MVQVHKMRCVHHDTFFVWYENFGSKPGQRPCLVKELKLDGLLANNMYGWILLGSVRRLSVLFPQQKLWRKHYLNIFNHHFNHSVILYSFHIWCVLNVLHNLPTCWPDPALDVHFDQLLDTGDDIHQRASQLQRQLPDLGVDVPAKFGAKNRVVACGPTRRLVFSRASTPWKIGCDHHATTIGVGWGGVGCVLEVMIRCRNAMEDRMWSSRNNNWGGVGWGACWKWW